MILSFEVKDKQLCSTGWSLKTVDCNIFLTSPKISKRTKTQYFLESSYREVLVFWCFKTVRCVKICLLKLFQYRVFATQYKAWALPYTLIRIQTLNKSISSTQIPLEKLLRHPSDICRQHKTVKDVIRHQQTKIDVNINCHTSLNSLFGCLATSVGVVWCLLLSWSVPRYLKEVSESIWVKCMYVCGVWMRLRVYKSVEAVNGAANALLWKSSKAQNFTYLTILNHQNTKTSLNELSKNHWVIALFEIFGPVRNKLLMTVSLDHPVPRGCCL